MAADDLETALGAYGGALLEGFELSGAAGFDEWLLMRRERLESTHRRATQAFAQHLERRGEWRRALELLRSLLGRDDLEERTHAEIMRLHDLLGEREAALLQFEHCRSVLQRELGLEPLPETIQLADRIRNPQLLRSDPVRTAVDASWWLPTHAPLIGRAAVWERMQSAWAAGQVICLSGEPGIGKTRLLMEFAASQGEYLLNAARPGDTIAPYSTATRTITDLLERYPPTELPPWVRRELSKLVPDLSDQPPPAVGSLEQRRRLFSAFVELVMLALKDAPALVIDDLQFFDSASLALGLHAAQRLAAGGKRVLVAFRRGELQLDTQALLEQLLSNGQGVLIELEALQELDTLALVRGLSGSGDATLFSQRLHRATGGNPFFALETLRSLFDSELLSFDQNGHWNTPYDVQTTDYAELPIPASVREAVLRRVRQLGSGPQRLLEAASLTADGFGLETLEGATALSEWEGLEALETALRARILEAFGEGYRFAHDLMRSALSEQLPLERKKLLHRKLAANVEKNGGQPALIADHLERAGLRLRAVSWRVKVAEAAAGVYANQAALEQYQWALEDGASAALAFSIRQARARLWLTLNQYADLELEIAQIEQLSQQLGTVTARASATLCRCQSCNAQANFESALQLAETVLALPKLPSDLLFRARFESVVALQHSGRLSQTKDLAEQTLRLHPKATPVMRAQLHEILRLNALHQGDLELALVHARTVETLYREVGDTNNRLEILKNWAAIHHRLGQTAQVVSLLEQSLSLAREMGAVTPQQHALINLAGALNQLGQCEQAIEHLRASLALPGADRNPHLQSHAHNTLATVFEEQGRCGEALSAYGQAFQTAEDAKLLHEVALCALNLAELHLSLHCVPGAEPFLERAAGLIEDQHSEFAAWQRCLLAKKLLLDHQAQRALRLFKLNQPQNQSADDHDLESLCKARAHLMLGQPDKAIAQLSSAPKSARYSDGWAATKLRALTAVAGITDQDIRQALTHLRANEEHLEALELRSALIDAYESRGQRAEAQELRSASRLQVQRIGEGLSGHPAARLAFLEYHRDS